MNKFDKVAPRVVIPTGLEKHYGFGYKLLGDLQHSMSFQSLTTGSLAKKLADGTVIKVTSSFGDNKIEVIPPRVLFKNNVFRWWQS